MKGTLFLMVVLALALPLAAFADNETFTSVGGTFSGDSSGYVLTGATLTGITDTNGTFTGASLGTVSFGTAELGSISNVVVGGPINRWHPYHHWQWHRRFQRHALHWHFCTGWNLGLRGAARRHLSVYPDRQRDRGGRKRE